MNLEEQLIQFVNQSEIFLQNSQGIILIKDLSSTCVGVSKSLCQLLSMKKEDFIGYKDIDLPWANFNEQIKVHDKEAATTKSLNVLEPFPFSKNIILPIDVIKSAIINSEGETIGILAQSHANLFDRSITKFLTSLSLKDKKIDLHILERYRLDNYDSNWSLTKREVECLFLLIHGKTAKEIAKFLNISFRTVETYIEKIKNKLQVESRSEIIEKAIESNLLEIIPKNAVLAQLYKNFDKWKCFFE